MRYFEFQFGARRIVILLFSIKSIRNTEFSINAVCVDEAFCSFGSFEKLICDAICP